MANCYPFTEDFHTPTTSDANKAKNGKPKKSKVKIVKNDDGDEIFKCIEYSESVFIYAKGPKRKPLSIIRRILNFFRL